MRSVISAVLITLLLVPGATVFAAPASTPGNDDINSAVSISSLPYTSSATDITSATEDAGDPSYPSYCYNSPETSNKPYKTVWYTYTAAVSGMMRVDTTSSEYDTVLAVWHGSPGALALSGCNDDTSGTKQSLLDVWVTQSTTYYIEVGAFSAVESGNLVLHVELPAYALYVPLAISD